MTTQEEEMIRGLVERVQKTQLAEKDAAAEQMLQQGLGHSPDAIYILAQTVLVQKYALEQAQAQIAQAKQQMEDMRQHEAASSQPKSVGSFLGNLLHLNDAPAGSSTSGASTATQALRQGFGTGTAQYVPGAPPPPQPGYGQQGYGGAQQFPPQYGGPQYGAPQYGAPQGGGFLRGAMQTAAGVAAGALAFEGVESLMHGFGNAAGYGGGSGLGGFGGGSGGGFGERPEVVNNYYDSPGGEHGGGEHGVSSGERDEGAREDRFGAGGSDGSGSADGGSGNVQSGSDTGSSFADTSGGGGGNYADDSGDVGSDADASADDDSGNAFSDGGSGDDSGSFGGDDGGGGGDDSNY